MTRTPSQQGAYKRRKGRAREQELVRLHKDMGVHAERTAPLQTAGNGNYGDLDIFPFGKDRGALVCECKSGAQIPKTIGKWLSTNDVLFLRPDREDWMVVVPWRVWERLVS